MANNRLNGLDRWNFAKKMGAYSLAAGGTLACAGAADAAIVNFDPPGGLPITGLVKDGPISVDLDGDSTVDFEFLSWFDDIVVFDGGNEIVGTVNGNYGYASNLGLGTVIRSTSGFASGPYGGMIYIDREGVSLGSPFLDDRGFLGLQFDVSGSFHYGYLDIEVDHDDGSPRLTIYGGAYEDAAGAGIAAGSKASNGQIPEPASALVWLALGAVGVGAWRRRNRKQAEA